MSEQAAWVRDTVNLLARCLPDAHLSTSLDMVTAKCGQGWTIRFKTRQPSVVTASAIKGSTFIETTVTSDADIVGWLSSLEINGKPTALDHPAWAPWTRHLVWEGLDTPVHLSLGDEGRTLIKPQGSTRIEFREMLSGGVGWDKYTVQIPFPYDPLRPLITIQPNKLDAIRHLEAACQIACHRHELGHPTPS